MTDPTFPQLDPEALELQLRRVNRALTHIEYAKLALSKINEMWVVDPMAELETAEAGITAHRDRELVS